MNVQRPGQELSEHKPVEKVHRIANGFLKLVNESRSKAELIRACVIFFQKESRCEAVGIRLKEGDDYPYFEARGFPQEFVILENRLCARDEDGRPMRDSTGYPIMECMCGNVIQGRFDPSKPFFSPKGSFWTNCTTKLLATTTEADRQGRTRNRCNVEGYESVALIALRAGEQRLGLLQLNDRQKGRFSGRVIAEWERLAGYLAVALSKLDAEEKLHESEERYRSLFENMKIGFAYCKMLFEGDEGRDFVYLSVNSLFEALTGLRNVTGKRVSEVIPGIRESQPELFEIYGRVASTGTPEQFEICVETLGRMWFSVSVYSPKQDHFVAVFDDITKRKRAEEAVRESEERLRLTLEATKDGIWDWNIPTGKAELSPPWYTMLGYEPYEFPQDYASFRSLVHPDDIGRVEGELAKHIGRNEGYTIELRMRAKSGDWVWILTCGKAVEHDADGRPVRMVGTHTDITDRKLAEETLRRLASFPQMNPDPVLEMNASCKFTYFNPAAENVLEKLGLGKRNLLAFLPKDIHALLKGWDEISESVVSREVMMRHMVFYETFQFIPEFRVMRIYARDITERKRATEALMESEYKFKHLAEKSSVGIYLIQDGLFKYVNPSLAQMCGYPIEELIAKKGPADLIPPEEFSKVLTKLRSTRLNKTVTIREKFRHVTKQGELKTVEIYGSQTMYDGRRAIVGTLLDITDQELATEVRQNLFSMLEKKNEELEIAYDELKESQNKVIQQEKLASIGQLAAGVAHEINNPMSFIISNLGSLQKYMAEVREFIAVQSQALETMAQQNGESQERMLKGVADSRRSLKIDYICEDSQDLIMESLEGADRVKRIVQDLKNLSRADEGAYAPANINEVLDGTINVVWNEIKHRATLKRKYGEIPLIVCNAGQLSQVFMNILVNAVQAMEKFGEVTIRTWQADACVHVAISDTGSGIPESQLGKIFDPFFTTKEIGKGTGLGLSIAYDIVKKHKGTIKVVSKVRKGTAFVVTISFEGNRNGENAEGTFPR